MSHDARSAPAQAAPSPAGATPIPRNRSLDILRAIAVIVVVNCHIATSFGTYAGMPQHSGGWLHVLQLGGHGVDLFFVLSGWLLGSILAQEYLDKNSINVKRFLLRRWLRTLPAYYAVLAMLLSQQVVSGNGIRWEYFIFLQNYLDDIPFFSVSWSLCVEEHFYLIIGPLLLFVLKSRWRFVAAFTTLLVLPVVVRHLGWGTLQETHARIDQCAVGVGLACLFKLYPSTYVRVSRLIVFALPISFTVLLWAIWSKYSGHGDPPHIVSTYICASLVAP